MDYYDNILGFDIDEIKSMNLVIGGILDHSKYEVGSYAGPVPVGETGYIDGVKPSDMTHPIEVGTDRYGRVCVCFRMKFADLDEPVVETVFQRYSDREDIWVSGGGRRALAKRDLGAADLVYLTRLVSGDHCGLRKYTSAFGDGEHAVVRLPEDARHVEVSVFEWATGATITYEIGTVELV